MLSFNFYCPTRYIFGKDAMDFFPDALREQKAQKILLVHYGEGGGEPSTPVRAVSEVKEAMTANGFEFQEFTGVQANPVYSLVLKGIEVCRAYQPDCF